VKPQTHPNTANPVGDVQPHDEESDLVRDLVRKARETAEPVRFQLFEDGKPLDSGARD
jgi:hypothetical protein